MIRTNRLSGKRIAILVDAGFHASEFYALKQSLQNVGAEIEIVSPSSEVRAWSNSGWGEPEKVDRRLEDSTAPSLARECAKDYDGVVIPGGVLHVDRLRASENAIEFIRHFLEEGKPIAAFNHGVQSLISTGEMSGLHLTGPRSLMRDFIHAGAHWDEQELVVDHGLITGHGIIDGAEQLNSFCEKMVNEFASELSPSHVRMPRTLQSQVLH